MLMLCQHLQNYLKQQFPSLIVLPFCAHHRSRIRLDSPKNALAAGALPQTPLGELTALPQTPLPVFPPAASISPNTEGSGYAALLTEDLGSQDTLI